MRLVRENHGNIGADELESLKVITLINKKITCIDNLEIFSNLVELFLSHNQISTIENLEFLPHLEVLDVAYNCITSQSLRASFENIPKSLQALNLSGNPCSEDEAVLSELQEMFPDLGIIIGVEDDVLEDIAEAKAGEEVGDDDDDDDDADEGDDVSESPAVSQQSEGPVVHADEVLKYIVDRKCRLQNLETVNVESIKQQLTEEGEQAVRRITKWRKDRWGTSITEKLDAAHAQSNDESSRPSTGTSMYVTARLSKYDQQFSKMKEEAKDMLEQSKRNTASADAFMERMRKKREDTREKLLKEAKASADDKYTPSGMRGGTEEKDTSELKSCQESKFSRK